MTTSAGLAAFVAISLRNFLINAIALLRFCGEFLHTLALLVLASIASFTIRRGI